MEKKKEFYAPEYIPVFRSALIDPKIDKQDCLVLGAIYWYERLKDGRCTASNASISKVINSKNVKSVSNSLKRLEENGYIVSTFKDAKKRNRIEIACLINKLDKKTIHPQMSRDPSTDESRDPSTDGQNKNSIEKNNENNSKAIALKDEPGIFIDLFKKINPTYSYLFSRKPQRDAARRLLKLRPQADWEKVIGFIARYRGKDRFFPHISTPVELEQKYAKLEEYAAALKKPIGKYDVTTVSL